MSDEAIPTPGLLASSEPVSGEAPPDAPPAAPAPIRQMPVPVHATKIRERKNPNQREIKLDENGCGFALFPRDVDQIAGAKSVDPSARITVSESHTVTISRIDVSNATARNGTILVTVITK